MREQFFVAGLQNFYLFRLVGAMVIIIGFAMLLGSILNSTDAWRAMKDYPNCMRSIDADLPEYSQLRLSYCQSSFYNITGVQLQTNQPLTKIQQAQILLNSIIKICLAIAAIFFGLVLYRPFPTVRAQHWPQRKAQAHHKK